MNPFPSLTVPHRDSFISSFLQVLFAIRFEFYTTRWRNLYKQILPIYSIHIDRKVITSNASVKLLEKHVYISCWTTLLVQMTCLNIASHTSMKYSNIFKVTTPSWTHSNTWSTTLTIPVLLIKCTSIRLCNTTLSFRTSNISLLIMDF